MRYTTAADRGRLSTCQHRNLLHYLIHISSYQPVTTILRHNHILSSYSELFHYLPYLRVYLPANYYYPPSRPYFVLLLKIVPNAKRK